jgi:hypothetical protein
VSCVSVIPFLHLSQIAPVVALFPSQFSLLNSPFCEAGNSTIVEESLQIHLFLQNEPKFRKSQMNVSKVLTMNYEKYDTWWTGTKRTQTNPNEPKFKIGKMNASSIVTKDYENICPCRAPKNEPKTNPICEKARNERNHLFYKELRKYAPPEASGQQTQSNPISMRMNVSLCATRPKAMLASIKWSGSYETHQIHLHLIASTDPCD